MGVAARSAGEPGPAEDWAFRVAGVTKVYANGVRANDAISWPPPLGLS
jgi:hypothetical protein